ncbi:MAG: hypothetical protein FWF72_02580 [Paludibacter sp.]|nr:hypothetical protein [Paludibacter sp.]
MKKITQNITKLAVAAFLLLQCAVCFAADLSIDSTGTSAIFIEENAVIAGVDNIFVDDDYDNVLEKDITILPSEQIEQISNAEIKSENQSTHSSVHIDCIILQDGEQLPLTFLIASNSVVAVVPTDDQKRYKKLLFYKSGIFKALSKLLNNNYIFKLTFVNIACINAVICVSSQCGCLTAFAANSPPRFI